MSKPEIHHNSVLATVARMDDLWIDACHLSDASCVVSVTETTLSDELAALCRCTGEFVKFAGPPRQVSDFEAVSGHEAARRFAERILRFTTDQVAALRVLHGKWIYTRRCNDLAGEDMAAHMIQRGREDLLRTLTAAFDGWKANRVWIRRSIQEEQRREHGNGLSPALHEVCEQWVAAREQFKSVNESKAQHAVARALADATDMLVPLARREKLDTVVLQKLLLNIDELRYAGSGRAVTLNLAEDVAPIASELASRAQDQGLNAHDASDTERVETLALKIIDRVTDVVTGTRPPTARKEDAEVDRIGHDLLCEAWNDGGMNGYKPKWKDLATGVTKRLAEVGRSLQLETVKTHLKQRAPRTKAKMNEIQAELAQRKQSRIAAQKKKTLPPKR